MRNKTNIFADLGERRPGTDETGFRTGMIRNTIAMAEDVNTYGYMIDEQVEVITQEIVNALTGYGITIDPNLNNQIFTMLNTKIPSGYALTGIDVNSYTTAPTQSGNAIAFPAMKVIYNKDVYYGNTTAKQQITTLSAQTLSASNSWANGVHFIYAETTAGSTTCALAHSQDAVAAKDGATKCFLGSVFVINGTFQSDSWKFQPWLQITSPERRESPTALTRGGYISPASATTLQMGDLEILDEGIGFEADITTPSITNVSGKSPYDYKFLYPGYNPSSSALTTLDTTHIYNTTASTWDDISSLVSDTNPHFIVMVPCVVPTGQTLMIPAMSPKNGSTYTQIYDTMEEAINHVYGLSYSLGSVAKRAIYLGQSIIVRVGATDLTDPLQCITVGMLPEELSDFTTASGQTGGAISTYRPMPQINWTGSTAFTAQNNAANYIQSGSSDITITLPTPQPNIVNQLEIYFNKVGTGTITWNTAITWYTGVTPSFTQGRTYNIILEYIGGTWYGGILSVA